MVSERFYIILLIWKRELFRLQGCIYKNISTNWYGSQKRKFYWPTQFNHLVSSQPNVGSIWNIDGSIVKRLNFNKNQIWSSFDHRVMRSILRATMSAFFSMSMGAYGTLWKTMVKLTYAYDLGLYGTERIVVIAEAWPQNVAPSRTSQRWYEDIFTFTVTVNVNYKMIVSNNNLEAYFKWFRHRECVIRYDSNRCRRSYNSRMLLNWGKWQIADFGGRIKIFADISWWKFCVANCYLFHISSFENEGINEHFSLNILLITWILTLLQTDKNDVA